MGKKKNYSKYLAKGSAIVFIALIISALAGLGLRMFLTRALSVEEYGLFYAVLAFFLIIHQIPRLGLNSSLKKYLPEFKVKEKFDSLKSSIAAILLIQTASTLAIIVPILVFSKQIAIGFFGTPAATPILRILSIWFIINIVVRLGRSILLGFQDTLGFSITRGFEIPSIFIIIAIFSIFLDLKSIHVAIAYVIGFTITGVWILIRLQEHRSILRKGKVMISKPLAKKLLVYGLPLIFAGLTSSIIGRIDQIAITAFRSVREVGLYEVAYPIRGFLTYFGIAVATPLFPMLSELWAKNDKARLQSTLHFLVKFAFIGMIPTVLIVLAFPDVIINVLFGSEYLGATLALQILTISAIAQALSKFAGAGLKAAEQTFLFGKIMIFSAIINLLGDIILVPFLGIEGAAIATVFTFTAAFFLYTYYVREFIKFPVPFSSITKALIGGVLTLLLVYGLRLALPLPLWPKLFAVIISVGLFYIVWILTTGALVRKDLRMLNRVVPMPKWLRKIARRMARK